MLRISVVSHNDRPPDRPARADFDELGGKIGRGEDNTLVLPDQQRFISRTHALVQFRNGVFVLCDVGSASPVVVNGRQLGNGQEAVIEPGDEIRIASYTLRVDGGEAPSRSASNRVASSDGMAPTDDPLAAFGGPAVASDPFDLSSALPPRRPPTAKPARTTTSESDRGRSDGSQSRASQASVIPDDFDPFGDPPRTPSPVASPGPDVLGVGLAGVGVGDNRKIDELFDLPAGSTSAPFPRGSAFGIPDDLAASAASTDPLVAIGAVLPPQPSRASQRDDVPEIHGSFRVPQVRPSAEAVREADAARRSKEELSRRSNELSGGDPAASLPAVASPQRAHAQTGDHDALLRAFLAGAGVPDVDIPGGMTPQLMNLIGQVLRESTQGTLDLLITRATTKRQLRVETTMLVARENNPLKFSPTAEDALERLLAPKGPAFMTPVRAMRDAYNDLRSHEVGFIAGVRAALTGILARFSPGQLEQRLARKTVLDSLLAINRQAKLWELFEQLYAEISREAEDNFHVLFGKEFMRAYEEQIARLEAEESKGKDVP